jgi:hypothetical protein
MSDGSKTTQPGSAPDRAPAQPPQLDHRHYMKFVVVNGRCRAPSHSVRCAPGLSSRPTCGTSRRGSITAARRASAVTAGSPPRGPPNQTIACFGG